MTLDQIVETARRRNNAESDSNWSNDEIYQLITNRCNEIISVIGLLERTTTVTSTQGTQSYAYPDGAVSIRQVNYLNQRLKKITFRQWDLFQTDLGTPQGRPDKFVVWNQEIILVPVPSNTGDDITIYYYGEHPYIDGTTQTTVDVPSVLHPHIINGVLADMFAKDLNVQMTQYYENKWQSAYEVFHRYKANLDDAGQFSIIGDSDTDNNVEIL